MVIHVRGNRVAVRSAMAAAVVALTVPACAVHGLSLTTDTRVKIQAPAARSTAPLPITLRWTAHDLAGRSFGVLVDHAPQPPGKTLSWLFRSTCSSCADAAYLAQRGVYTTDATQLTLANVAPKPTSQEGNFHQITIVLLDANGRRVGESAWSVDVKVPGRQ